MASLKSLTLTALPQIQVDPVMDRRNRTIAHLEEQKRLIQDPQYTRTVKVWVEKDGERQQVEKRRTAAGRKEAARVAVVEAASKWLCRADGSRCAKAH